MTGLVRPELQSRLAGLEAGEIDMVSEGVGVTGAKPYIDHPDYTVQFQAGVGWSVHNVYPNLWLDTVITRSYVNWPKGGRVGLMNFITHFAAQRLKT